MGLLGLGFLLLGLELMDEDLLVLVDRGEGSLLFCCWVLDLFMGY